MNEWINRLHLFLDGYLELFDWLPLYPFIRRTPDHLHHIILFLNIALIIYQFIYFVISLLILKLFELLQGIILYVLLLYFMKVRCEFFKITHLRHIFLDFQFTQIQSCPYILFLRIYLVLAIHQYYFVFLLIIWFFFVFEC